MSARSSFSTFSLGGIAASVAMGVLANTLPTPASAGAPPPAGTIGCSVFSVASSRPTGILFHPPINDVPRTIRIKATNNGSSCDNSLVTGGKVPITGVAIKFTARMSDGTCGTLTSPTPPLENARLTLKWRGVTPTGHFVTVATSRAKILEASYDPDNDHALFLETEPLTGNAFVGSTLCLSLGFDDFVEVFEAGCPSASGFASQGFGNTNPASLDVQ